jgi:hypothetical protein
VDKEELKQAMKEQNPVSQISVSSNNFKDGVISTEGPNHNVALTFKHINTVEENEALLDTVNNRIAAEGERFSLTWQRDKILKTLQKQHRRGKKMFGMARQFQERYEERNKRLEKEARLVLSYLPPDDACTLIDVCTVHVPEKKDENNVTIAEASEFVNYLALIHEARLMVSLNRIARTKAGLRKRSSGRGSVMSNDNAVAAYVQGRNTKARAENDVRAEIAIKDPNESK